MLEYKVLPISEVKVVSEEADCWEVEGYVSTVDLDMGNDRMSKDAFEETIEKNYTQRVAKGCKPKVKFLYQHDHKNIIGWPVSMRSDDKGLYCKFKFIDDPDFPEARKAYKLCKMGLLDSFSIGYMSRDEEYLFDEEKEMSVRFLKKVDLYECSLVSVPMNPEAQISKVKTLEGVSMKEQLTELIAEVKALRDQVAELKTQVSEHNAVVSEKLTALEEKAVFDVVATEEGLVLNELPNTIQVVQEEKISCDVECESEDEEEEDSEEEKGLYESLLELKNQYFAKEIS